MKSSPPTSLSSHVIESKSMKKEQVHSIALTAIICEEVALSVSLTLCDAERPYRNCNYEPNEDSCQNCDCSLSIVLIFEKSGVL